MTSCPHCKKTIEIVAPYQRSNTRRSFDFVANIADGQLNSDDFIIQSSEVTYNILATGGFAVGVGLLSGAVAYITTGNGYFASVIGLTTSALSFAPLFHLDVGWLHHTDTEEHDTDTLPTGLKRTGPNKMQAFAYPDGWSNEDMRAFARCAMRAMDAVDKKTRQPKQRFSEADITSGSRLGSGRVRALRDDFVDLKYVMKLPGNKGYAVTERGKLAFSELLGYKRPPTLTGGGFLIS